MSVWTPNRKGRPNYTLATRSERISATRFKVGFALSLSVKERERESERRDREKKNKECVCVRGREREGERKRQCKPLFQTVLGILEKLILKYLVTLVGSPKLTAPTTTVQKKCFTTVQQIFSRLPSRLGNNDDSDGARRQRRRRQRSQQRLLCMHLHACINWLHLHLDIPAATAATCRRTKHPSRCIAAVPKRQMLVEVALLSHFKILL